MPSPTIGLWAFSPLDDGTSNKSLMEYRFALSWLPGPSEQGWHRQGRHCAGSESLQSLPPALYSPAPSPLPNSKSSLRPAVRKDVVATLVWCDEAEALCKLGRAPGFRA